MSPERQTAIEKIKKLLALATSNNVHESSLAMEKARQMMLQHNLDASDVASNDLEDIIEIDHSISSKSTATVIQLAFWIGQAFCVSPLILKQPLGNKRVENRIRFIGVKTDVVVASHVFDYMKNLIAIKSEEYLKSQKKLKVKTSVKTKNDFSWGFVSATIKKLQEYKESLETAATSSVAAEEYSKENPELKVLTSGEIAKLNALVVIKTSKIDEYIKEHVELRGKSRSKKSTPNHNDFVAGRTEGEKYGLYRGVATDTTQLKIGA
jgi:hypothetical protein